VTNLTGRKSKTRRKQNYKALCSFKHKEQVHRHSVLQAKQRRKNQKKNRKKKEKNEEEEPWQLHHMFLLNELSHATTPCTLHIVTPT
jgi:hypothetical protein